MYIRKISTRRLEEYKKLRLLALANHPESFGSSYEEEMTLTDKEFKKRLTHPDHIILGAFTDHELVGMITLVTSGRKKIKQNGHIVSMIVSPKHRTHGIGQKLMEAIIVEAKNRKVENLFLAVTNTNGPAINLYKKMGFQKYAVEKRSINVNQTYYDTDLMGLYI